MAHNVPDDWGRFWYRCPHCHARVHASEGPCECEGACDVCGEPGRRVGDRYLCAACLAAEEDS